MILSYHPCFVGDRNIICAGRQPGGQDRDAIKTASAVVLPQGCPETLYEMARDHCAHVFPDYRVRFGFPGKIGQARLFRDVGVAAPAALWFDRVADLFRQYPDWRSTPPMDFPFVLKFDWGGEGETVFLVDHADRLAERVDRAARMEKSGYTGILIQQYVPSGNRALRVAVIGRRLFTYWRVQDDARKFHANLSCGGCIDGESDPLLRQRAERRVSAFCGRTGINLAGFDLLFAADKPRSEPLFLEINWFFGRRGLGGSERFYRLLVREINTWLSANGLPPGRG